MANKTVGNLDDAGVVDNANYLPIEQGGILKKITWANIKAALKTYFDAFYLARFTSSGQTITSGGSLTIAHGLGVAPFIIGCYLQCTTAEIGYSIGDKLYIGWANVAVNGSNDFGVSVSVNGTANIDVRFGSYANVFIAPAKNTGTTVQLTNANWKFYIFAQK